MILSTSCKCSHGRKTFDLNRSRQIVEERTWRVLMELAWRSATFSALCFVLFL